MNDQDFVIRTLWDDCVRIARVNILSGSYSLLKAAGTPAELPTAETDTVSELLRRAVALGSIHPDDTQVYLGFAEKDRFAQLFSRAERKLTSHFRAMLDGAWQWLSLEILLPQDFSPTSPEVLFCWRLADPSYCVILEALKGLYGSFYKVLRVNLTCDAYESIKVDQHELNAGHSAPPTLSGWFRSFQAQGGVLAQDREAFEQFTDLAHLRQVLRMEPGSVFFRYRRSTPEGFRWASMELMPCLDCTDDNQVAMLYIRDVHNSEVTELNYRKQLENAATLDRLTGLKNGTRYETALAKLRRAPLAAGTGLLLAWISDLQWRNEHLGHEAANAFLQGFAASLSDSFGQEACYRLGSTFAVLAEDMAEDAFRRKVEQFGGTLHFAGHPSVALGSSWAPAGGSMYDVQQKAEADIAAARQSIRAAQQHGYEA